MTSRSIGPHKGDNESHQDTSVCEAATQMLIKSDLGNWIKMASRANVFVSKSQPKSPNQMTENTPIFFHCKFLTALEKHRGDKFGPEMLGNTCHMESIWNKHTQKKTATKGRWCFRVALCPGSWGNDQSGLLYRHVWRSLAGKAVAPCPQPHTPQTCTHIPVAAAEIFERLHHWVLERGPQAGQNPQSGGKGSLNDDIMSYYYTPPTHALPTCLHM